MAEIEININEKFRKIKIPKQDFLSKKSVVRPSIESSVVKELREIFDKFSDSNEVNPHVIKNALRSVDFHKENPDIYKIIEELCLDSDIKGKPLRFNDFLQHLNDRLGDNSSREGINKLFWKLADDKVGEITPQGLQSVLKELGDDLSIEDVTYILEKISEPSLDINITSDELYYIMTKKPADVDLFTPVAKSTK